MVYILPASSVHHAIDVLSPGQQSKQKDEIYAILGLSLNPYAKLREKLCKIYFRES